MATKDKTTDPDKETLRHRLTLLVANTLRTDAEEAKRAWERCRADAEQATDPDEKQDLLHEMAYYRGRCVALQGAAALVEENLL